MRFFPPLCAFAVLASVASAQTQPSKKLIEFGWDEPDTAFMRQHIAAMEQTPFDGTVFHVPGDFLWQAWGKRKFSDAELQPALDDLKNTPFKKFTHNFLRFNVAPGDVDWFDDFSAITGNARLAARIAKEGKAAGVLFDIEQYNTPLFTYASRRDAKTKSWDAYAAQARQRGREVMTAFQEGFPDLVVFLTFGHSLPYSETGGDRSKLSSASYGLLAPFLDGMYDVAKGNARIVDGFEISYGYKEMKQFDEVPVTLKQKILPMVGDRDKYLKHLSGSFGLWMDYDWRKNGWDANDPAKNYFTPEQFEKSLKKALDTADEFVWVYTEEPKWWTPPDGKPDKLPQAYADAVRRARGQ